MPLAKTPEDATSLSLDLYFRHFAAPASLLAKIRSGRRLAHRAGKPKVIDDLFHKATLQVNGNLIKLGSKVRAEFAAKIVELGQYGEMPIPKSDRACEKALESYRRYEAQMESTFRDLGEERSADPEVQARIVRELWKLFYARARPVG